MKRLLYTVALAVTLSTLAHAQDAKPSTKRVVLKNVLPTQAASMLGANQEATAKDMTTLTLDDKARTVTLTGSKKTVNELEKMLRLIDTKPQPIRLEMRLMQIPLTDERTLWEQMTQADFDNAIVVGEKTLETGNNSLCLTDFGVTSMDGDRWSFSISPRRSGNKAVQMRMSVVREERTTIAGPVEGTSGEQTHSQSQNSEVRIASGAMYRMPMYSGKSNAEDNSPRSFYYIQVTPTLR